MSFLTNKFFLLALTFGVFAISQLIQKKTRRHYLNPILITIVIMMCILLGNNISYDTYMEGGQYIDFWLKPAVVALALPLYRQLATIRKQFLPLIISECLGCIVGIVSVVLLAELFGATKEKHRLRRRMRQSLH